MEKFQTDGVIFDLDGTLWDSCEGVTEGYNQAARQMGLGKAFTQEDLRSIMGLQRRGVAQRLVPELPEEKQDEFLDLACRLECQVLRSRGSVLFPGVRRLLEALRPRCGLFLVSNCMDGYIEAFLAAHQLQDFFRDYEHPGRTGLSKGENNKLVIARNGLQKPLYFGDAQVDLDSAREAGIPFVWARYGFGSVTEYDAAVDSPLELLELLEFVH